MAELNIIEKVIALEAVDLLKNLSAEQLSRIASIAKEDAGIRPGRSLLVRIRRLDALSSS